jgi:tetratricopeptide (TPR) repeat protein
MFCAMRAHLAIFTILVYFVGASSQAGPGPAQPATNSTAAPAPSASKSSATKSDPAIEKEYQRLQAGDDAAQAEIQKWKREHAQLKASGRRVSDAELARRVGDRQQTVRKAYDHFLARHPDHVQARLSYGSFLSDLEDEAGAQAQWEKALQLDPRLAIAYNNLAGLYTERGEVRKAQEYFGKAVELRPSDGSFYHNFGDSVYVLRKGIMAQEGMTEQQVYARALGLYSNAFRLDPKNYQFASDLAQTYYALTPLPFETALNAWTNASAIAQDENERQLTSIHLARLKMLSGRLAEARAHLANVTNQECAQLKSNLLARIAEREIPPKSPGPPPGDEPKKN